MDMKTYNLNEKLARNTNKDESSTEMENQSVCETKTWAQRILFKL